MIENRICALSNRMLKENVGENAMQYRQEMIMSKENPLIKMIKSLQQKKFRKQYHSFLIEGIRNSEEALNSKIEITKALYSETLLQSERGRFLLNGLQEKEIPIFCCEEKVLSVCSDTFTCQGIILVGKIPEEKENCRTTDSQILVLDGVQDPGNLGAILRTAWAAGIKTVALLPGTVDPYSPKVVRAAMGALYHLNLCLIEDASLFYQELQQQNYEIWTTSVEKGIAYQKARKGEKWALVMGSEANGVSTVSYEAATHLVTIPMADGAESLNVSVATGILLFHFLLS